MTNLVEKLTVLFKAADEAAIAWDLAHPNADDGGSCNFDAPSFVLPKGTRISTVEKAATAAGCRVWKDRYRFVLHPTLNGQGFHRTNMAKAASNAMQELASELLPEMKVGMYYAMD
jgi:hypothetical protein